MFEQFRKYWRWIAVCWVISGLFPFWALLHEFGKDYGWVIAKTYPDLFIFPTYLGAFILLFIAGPFSKAIAIHRRKLLISVWIVLALAITSVQVFGGRAGAIWQVPKQQLDSSFEFDHARKDVWEHFSDPPDNAEHGSEQPLAKVQREQFQNALKKLIRPSHPTLTTVGWVLCVLVQALAQLAVMFSVLLYFRQDFYNLAPPLGSKSSLLNDSIQMFVALTLISTWLLFYSVKAFQTSKIYPQPNDAAEPFVFGLVLILCYLGCLYIMWKHKLPLLTFVLTAAGTLGLIGFIAKQIFDPKFLVSAFGRDANPAGYLLLPMAVLIVGFLLSPPGNGHRPEQAPEARRVGGLRRSRSQS